MRSRYPQWLKAARFLYVRKRGLGALPPSNVAWNAEAAPKLLGELIANGKPCMIARIGKTEMEALTAYCGEKWGIGTALNYIKGLGNLPHSWGIERVATLAKLSGFFPTSLEAGEQFCELMLADMPQLDVLGSWMKCEESFPQLHHAQRVHLCNLEPFDDSSLPWSQHLAGRKVLVVHPFAESIAKQYREKRALLFENPLVLPEFELHTIQAVQSLAGNHPPEFATWFEALNHMKAQIDATDYDVCLLGCGAYGFPLAAHVKRQGKQAVHMGGSLQLLFGIKGKRWVEQYGTAETNPYLKLFNEHWVYPAESEKPKNASTVESGCYW